MKIRTSFVSNSSSSSFICEICGRDHDIGFLSLRESGACYCENNHEICIDHLLCSEEELEALYAESKDIYEYIPEKYCPICQGEYVSELILADYARKMGFDEVVKKRIKEIGYKQFIEELEECEELEEE